jgi:L-threonylcarbamoyladenylate synthase
VETELLAISADRPEAKTIARAAEVLRTGGLVAFPTETVYGLGASARDPQAIARIFAAKGRPTTDPLILHVAEASEIASVARDIPDLALRLAERFWPGPLTLVLQRRPEIPASVSAGLTTVAVRVPSHPVARALIAAAGVPVAAPSANRFSRPSPTTARHVLDDLAGAVDMVLDGGPTQVGVESTVIDLTGAAPRMLRPGGVALETLRAMLPGLEYQPRYLGESTPSESPGSLLKHYSPRAELRLVAGPAPAVRAYLQGAAERCAREGRAAALLVADEDMAALAGAPALVASLGPADDMAGVAQALFAQIRALDARGVDLILVRGFDRGGLGLAIWDRLVRAAEGRVIEVGV